MATTTWYNVAYYGAVTTTQNFGGVIVAPPTLLPGDSMWSDPAPLPPVVEDPFQWLDRRIEEMRVKL